MAMLLLVSLASVALGQQEFQLEESHEEAWVTEVPCRGNANTEGRGWIGDREIRLCFKFQENMLQPTSEGAPNYSELLIFSYMKKGGSNLSDINLVPLFPQDHPGLILGDAVPAGPERTSALSSMRVFKASVQVTDQARSRKYPITAEVTSGTTTAEKIDFSLPILAPGNVPIEVVKKAGALVDCWTGSDCSPLEMVVRNKLPYKVTISNISISSEDLLQNKPVGNYVTDINNNSSPVDLNVAMKAKSITFRRLFSGFGVPQVMMRIDYRDEFGRPFFTETTADLQIRPNVLVISILLILGAIIGTFVRIDLGRLQRAGIITARQRILFAITTFVSGIIVCLIALFANIKVIVWSDQNSYSAWDPKVLFLTALVTTVSGLPILYAYLKLPRPATSTQANNNPPNAN
jgi:hypothetical protein